MGIGIYGMQEVLQVDRRTRQKKIDGEIWSGKRGWHSFSRKPPSLRLRPMSSSSAPLSPPRPRLSSTPGSATRARSSSASSASSLRALSPRSRRSSRTPRSSSRSSTSPLLMLRVRFLLLLSMWNLLERILTSIHRDRLLCQGLNTVFVRYASEVPFVSVSVKDRVK